MCVLCYNPGLVAGDAVLFGGPIVGTAVHRVRSVVRRRAGTADEPESVYGPGIPGGGAPERASTPRRPLSAAAVIAR